MKKYYIYVGILLMAYGLWATKITYAQNIKTGSANASSTIETNVSGNGNVTTHIETTVNGQTNTVNSNSPGKIEVKNENGTVTINKSPNVTITITQNNTSTPSPTLHPKIEQKNIFLNLFERISNFFKQIFSNL